MTATIDDGYAGIKHTSLPNPKTKAPLPPNATTSELMGYGSYSGADCKVVVHYPRHVATQNFILKEKEKIGKELFELDNRIHYLNNTPFNFFVISTRIAEAKQLDANRQALTSSLDALSADILTFKNLPTSKVLTELQTISYSIFREKSPVRTLGSVYPRAYVRGPRTIGGYMIFTVFNQHALADILKLNLRLYNTGVSDHDKFQYTTALSDQLPPLDISLIFANEYGSISHMGLWGVEFLQEGGTFSIEDIFSENVIQYVARDIDPLRLVDRREVDGQGIREEWGVTASHLLGSKQRENNTIYRRNQFI